MRVPVLKSDLPDKYNKVAKYIGRHWPIGKLTLSQAHEVTAYLLGYLSYHEIRQVAGAELPKSIIEMHKVHGSIIAKALIRYNVKPDDMKQLVLRVPFKEMAFYDSTDVVEAEKLLATIIARSDQRIVQDEIYQIPAQESIITKNTSELPPHPEHVIQHSYAVRPDGYIYSHSHYQLQLLNMGVISDVISNEFDGELTLQEFTVKHLHPLNNCSV